MTLYGGIEAGGTKFVCVVARGPEEIIDEIRFPTTTPEACISQCVAFLRGYQSELAAVGIASFGPVDPDPTSPTWGHVTTTPKPHWAHTNFAGTVQQALGLPVGFDTDVNGAALGEHRWGAAQGLETFVYLTVGTGIGGGGMVNGRLLHGLMHPEMGHMFIPVRPDDDYAGFCPYHGTCWEGLAAGPAIEGRWQSRGEALGPDHPAWELEAHYLALALVDLITILSPQRIIMGGGVMDQTHLFPLLREKTLDYLQGYIQAPALLTDIENYIVPPQLGNRAGALGAIALAQDAAQSR